MSDTPLTDAEVIDAQLVAVQGPRYAAVPATFARTLETTAETLRARVAELEKELEGSEPYGGDPTKWGLRAMFEIAKRNIADLTAQLTAAKADGERIEKLRWFTVNVRQPMRHGSLNVFYANPTGGDEEEIGPSDLREQVDKLPPAPTAARAQEETK